MSVIDQTINRVFADSRRMQFGSSFYATIDPRTFVTPLYVESGDPAPMVDIPVATKHRWVVNPTTHLYYPPEFVYQHVLTDDKKIEVSGILKGYTLVRLDDVQLDSLRGITFIGFFVKPDHLNFYSS